MQKLLLGGLLTATMLGMLAPTQAAQTPVAAPAAAPAAASATPADPVTGEKLAKADSDANDWLMVNRTYDSNRYSPLNKITPDNVSGLKVAFAVPLGGLEPAAFGSRRARRHAAGQGRLPLRRRSLGHALQDRRDLRQERQRSCGCAIPASTRTRRSAS